MPRLSNQMTNETRKGLAFQPPKLRVPQLPVGLTEMGLWGLSTLFLFVFFMANNAFCSWSSESPVSKTFHSHISCVNGRWQTIQKPRNHGCATGESVITSTEIKILNPQFIRQPKNTLRCCFALSGCRFCLSHHRLCPL